jgi:hypothetical protein
MIPANGAPHDLEARDALRSLSFAQRRARGNSKQIGTSPNCRRLRSPAGLWQFSGREFLISGTGCMQLQVHCIVEQPQDFDVALTLVGCDAE